MEAVWRFCEWGTSNNRQFITSGSPSGEELVVLVYYYRMDMRAKARNTLQQDLKILQMCAGENIQVVNCTTPANYSML